MNNIKKFEEFLNESDFNPSNIKRPNLFHDFEHASKYVNDTYDNYGDKMDIKFFIQKILADKKSENDTKLLRNAIFSLCIQKKIPKESYLPYV